MGHQIIKQPGTDTYAVFSSFTDQWILWNVTREDLMDYYATQAAREARRSVAATLDAVDENPREAYFQFAMTFGEANALSIKHGGPDITDPEAGEEYRPSPDDEVTDPRLPVAGRRDAEEARLRAKDGQEESNGTD